MTYFSRKHQSLSLQISEEFWEAFKAYIIELGRDGGFAEFGHWEPTYNDGYWVVNDDRVNLKMVQEIGKRLYPLDEIDGKPDDERIFDLIEFFFKYVTKPMNVDFDKRQGRYEYTIRINQLFDNFRLKYQLKKGEVGALHSEFFVELLNEFEFDMPDIQTKKLIDIALDKFSSRNIEEQKIGLEKLVDAYQRISSWEEQDKKKSVEKMLKKVSEGNEEIANILDKDSHELWQIANNFMIRHTEKGKIPINDPDCIEYLFYAYFNAIRLILKKYGYVKERLKGEENTDDLPF